MCWNLATMQCQTLPLSATIVFSKSYSILYSHKMVINTVTIKILVWNYNILNFGAIIDILEVPQKESGNVSLCPPKTNSNEKKFATWKLYSEIPQWWYSFSEYHEAHQWCSRTAFMCVPVTWRYVKCSFGVTRPGITMRFCLLIKS